MLSSSPAKIHKPHITGVSPRPTDQRGARKTAKHEGHEDHTNPGELMSIQELIHELKHAITDGAGCHGPPCRATRYSAAFRAGTG
jgi:hypothetical protein